MKFPWILICMFALSACQSATTAPEGEESPTEPESTAPAEEATPTAEPAPAEEPLAAAPDTPAPAEGVRMMTTGEKRRLWAPVDLAYGEKLAGAEAPAGQPLGMLVVDVTLVQIRRELHQVR